MNDDRKPALYVVEYSDDRSFVDKFRIPEHALRRRERIGKLVRDFQAVSLEFCTSEEEYEEFVSTLSRQDIDLMIKFFLSEIAIVESSNRIDIRKLRKLHPQKLWSSY